IGIVGQPHALVGQDEFGQFRMEIRRVRLNRRGTTSGWFRIGVGNERGLGQPRVAWPETGQVLFPRGTERHPPRGPLPRWRRSARVARRGKIERTPPEVHWTALADERRAVPL